MFPEMRKWIKDLPIYGKYDRHLFWNQYASLFILLLFVIIAALSSEYFLTWNNLMNLFRQASVIGLLSIGVHFVVMLGKIDLSVGSTLVCSGTIMMISQNVYHLSIPLTILLGLIIGLIIGVINGLLVTYARIPSLIVTLGMMYTARSLAQWIGSGGAINGKDINYTIIGHGSLFGIPFTLFILLIITILAHLVLTRTILGRYIQAIGDNNEAALLSGAPIYAVIITAFAISGAAAGLGAVIETSRLNSISTSNSGLSYELDAIAAIVIGGTKLSGGKGRIIGTLIGVLILAVINNYMNLMNILPYVQGILKGLLIITVLFRKNQ